MRETAFGGKMYNVCLLIMLLAPFSISCNYSEANHDSKPPLVAPAPTHSASLTANNTQEVNKTTYSSGSEHHQKGQIRDIDFRNFTYPWYPDGYTPPYKGRKVVLNAGKAEVDENQDKNIEWVSLNLDNVSYIDLTRDGKEEAIVILGGIITFNSFVNCIFVFTIEDGDPKLLWLRETGDRADGGLRSVRVDSGKLVIEQYDIKFNRSTGKYENGASLCCPKKFFRSHYKWNGKRFQKIKSEALPNEYDNAKFLGYPDDST